MAVIFCTVKIEECTLRQCWQADALFQSDCRAYITWLQGLQSTDEALEISEFCWQYNVNALTKFSRCSKQRNDRRRHVQWFPAPRLKALSTLATIRRQSPFLATVVEFGDYSRQCGQGLTSSKNFSVACDKFTLGHIKHIDQAT